MRRVLFIVSRISMYLNLHTTLLGNVSLSVGGGKVGPSAGGVHEGGPQCRDELEKGLGRTVESPRPEKGTSQALGGVRRKSAGR